MSSDYEYEPRVTPIHNSLNEIHTFMGAPKAITVMTLTFGAAFVVAFKSWLFVPLFTFIALKLLAYISQRDQMQGKVFVRRVQLSDYYDPWPKPKQKRGSRPLGFGRGVLR